jgi:ATP-dependent Clp protease ATP-binding subunit ClpA
LVTMRLAPTTCWWRSHASMRRSSGWLPSACATSWPDFVELASGASPPDALPFSAEAMAAIERADDQATSRGHTRVRPGHVLLAVLGADNTASRILSEVGLPEHKARAWAEHAAEHPASGGARASPQRVAGRVSALDEGRFEDAIRDGHPVMVRLHKTPPLGDVGNALVDARLLKLMLAADGRLGRMLRAHGVDEATVDAALKPPA